MQYKLGYTLHELKKKNSMNSWLSLLMSFKVGKIFIWCWKTIEKL